MRGTWFGLAAWLMAAPGGLTARADGEMTIALARVPSAVVESARQAAPGVTIEKAVKTVEEGKTSYDLIGHDARGREVDVELTARGQVIGVGTEIPMASVPRSVLAALKPRSKGMTFHEAEAVTLNGRPADRLSPERRRQPRRRCRGTHQPRRPLGRNRGGRRLTSTDRPGMTGLVTVESR